MTAGSPASGDRQMRLTVNIRRLRSKNATLRGEIQAAELDLETRDEMIQAVYPLRYDLEAQLTGGAILVRGTLEITLACYCVRCLRAFDHRLVLADWSCYLPLTGEERAPIRGDVVDLTPYLREDILLQLPQHPLCEPDCGGLSSAPPDATPMTGAAREEESNASAWAELNKLKF